LQFNQLFGEMTQGFVSAKSSTVGQNNIFTPKMCNNFGVICQYCDSNIGLFIVSHTVITLSKLR
jgi:hypothetical protein